MLPSVLSDAGTWVAAVCAVVVGATLVVSGTAKIGRARSTRKAMVDLAVPHALRRPAVASVLPAAEILVATAMLLLPDGWHHLAGGLAAALLLCFTVLLAGVVRRGRTVDCACFGVLGRGRVTGAAVGRNAALTLAALVYAVGRVSLQGAAQQSPVSGSAWWIALLILVLAVSLRLDAWRRRRAHIDALALTDFEGRVLAFRELVDPPTFLVFLTPGCGACAALVPRLRTWPTAYGEVIDIQPVLVGTPEQFAADEAFAPLREHVLYDRERRLVQAMEITAFPTGAVLTPRNPLDGDLAPGHGPMQVELDRLQAVHCRREDEAPPQGGETPTA